MRFDLRECVYQLRALLRLCFLHPNSWREVILGLIAILLAPLVVLSCVLNNQKK